VELHFFFKFHFVETCVVYVELRCIETDVNFGIASFRTWCTSMCRLNDPWVHNTSKCESKCESCICF